MRKSLFSSNSKYKVIPSAKTLSEPPPPLPPHSEIADSDQDNTENGQDRNPTLRLEREAGHHPLTVIPIIW